MIDYLFSSALSRLKLLRTTQDSKDRLIKISVYRNHSFEMVASVLNAFLKFSDLYAEFNYSDYDDSLNFQFEEADIQLIWIDIERYKKINLEEFINERVEVLRSKTQSHIIVAISGKIAYKFSCDISDSTLIYIDEELSILSELYDIEKEPYSGTKLSNKACIEFARILGLKYIPAILKKSFKAVIVDLDNTLYQGILGEDGIDSIIPNLGLQKILKSLKDNGFFLCIASKNEEQDVKELFSKRDDFILKWDDFASYKINWESKAENIIQIAKDLNIGIDSMLFIDDNPAEIQNVSIIGIKTLLADENICQVLKYYPGLLKLKLSKEDSLRSLDIKANKERELLSKTLSKEDYFKKLGIVLEYGINVKEYIPRVSELLNKTNQFILSYVRFNETQVKEYINDKNKIVVTIKMSDNLSDSGIIAILVASKLNEDLIIDELTVSCRALGRNLESTMIPYAFNIAYEYLKCKNNILIKYTKGDRNMPALNWLEEYTQEQIKESGIVVINNVKNIDTNGLLIEVVNG